MQIILQINYLVWHLFTLHHIGMKKELSQKEGKGRKVTDHSARQP